MKIRDIDYEEIIKGLNDVTVMIDSRGHFAWVSPQVEDVFGYTREEVIGEDAFDFIHEDDIPKAMEGLQKALETGHYHLEYRARHKDGHFIHLSGSGKLLMKDDDPRIVAQIKDITHQKEMEARLKNSERKYRDIIENMQDVYYRTDLKGNLIMASPSGGKLLGYEPGSKIGDNVKDSLYFDPEDRKIFVEKLMKEGRVENFQTKLRRSDGKTVTVLAKSHLIYQDGKPVGIEGILTDITSLKEVEEKQRFQSSILNQVKDLVTVTDLEGNITYVNQAEVDFFDLPEEELIGKNVLDYGDPDEERNIIERTLKEGEYTGTVVNYTYQGKEKILEVKTSLFRDPDGTPSGMVGISRDVTEKVKTRYDLKDSENRIRRILQSSPDSIVMTDLEGTIIDCNKRTLDLHGYDSKDEIIGINAFDMIMPEYHDLAKEKMKETMEKGGVYDVEYKLLKKGGSSYYATLSSNLLLDSEGNPKGFVATIKDITEKMKQQRELLLSDAILNQMPEAVIVTDLNGKITRWMGNAEEIFGYSSEEAVGNPVNFIHRSDIRDGMIRRMMEDISENGYFHGEIPCVRNDGDRISVETASKAVYDENSETIAIISINKDISSRKEIERRLEENRRELLDNKNFLNSIFESIQDGISVLDTDLTIRHVNSMMKKWYKESLPLEGRKCFVCYHGRDEHCDPCPSLRCLKTGNTETDTVRGPNGTPIEWLELFSYPIKDENGVVTGIVEFVRDVTQKKMALEALENSEKGFRNVLETMNLISVTLDTRGKILFCNDFFLDLTGYEREEVMGKSWFEFFIPEKDQAMIQNEVFMNTVKDGNIYPHYENPIKTKDGDIRLIRWNNTTRYDPSGKVVSVTSIGEDITESRKAKMLLESEKERAELYLDLLGHDLGNIHQGLAGALEILSLKREDPKTRDRTIDLSNRAVRKSMELTRNVMLLSRLRSEDPVLKEINLKQAVEDSVEQIRGMFRDRDIEIDQDLDESKIRAEPLIKELFINILHNAVRLQDEDPWICIEARSKGDLVEISISDRGPGIPDRTKKNLFKRFGTRGDRTRTGLGLSIVKALVERYNGQIRAEDRVEGDPGRGAKFVIELPLITKRK